MTKRNVALITGANSGLGWEAAAQLAEAGFESVILTARTRQKAEQAQRRLEDRTGKDLFSWVTLDNGEPQSVEKAAAQLGFR